MPDNSTINQGFPQIAFQFVDSQGNILAPWYRLLVSLWNRTGGGSTPGFISQIETGPGLTGGPINGNNPNGTISLAQLPAQTFLANPSSALNFPDPTTETAFLDAVIGDDQGTMMFRSSSGWIALPPGQIGQILESGGPAADISWEPNTGGLLPWVTGEIQVEGAISEPCFIITPDGQTVGVPVL